MTTVCHGNNSWHGNQAITMATEEGTTRLVCCTVCDICCFVIKFRFQDKENERINRVTCYLCRDNEGKKANEDNDMVMVRALK